MFIIIAGIASLTQYVHVYSEPEQATLKKPSCCPHCHHNILWNHGSYPRNPDRKGSLTKTLNPILIPRYRCAKCRRTFSALPEFLPPKRWYDWPAQQEALQGYLNGKSYRQLASSMSPSRSTLSRWIRRLKDQLLSHADHLKQWVSDLQLHTDFRSFWKCCLSHCTLARAMRSLHESAVVIP